MPDVTVGAGEVSSGRFNLVAGQVSTVTFADNVETVQIASDGTAAVYFTVRGQTPTVDGRGTYEIPQGPVAIANKRAPNSVVNGGLDVIKLISAGNVSVRVERDD